MRGGGGEEERWMQKVGAKICHQVERGKTIFLDPSFSTPGAAIREQEKSRGSSLSGRVVACFDYCVNYSPKYSNQWQSLDSSSLLLAGAPTQTGCY